MSVSCAESVPSPQHRIADLALSLHANPPPSPDQVIKRIVDYAASAIPGAEYAGVTHVFSRQRVTTAATTHPYPAVLDSAQQMLQEGPCYSAARDQQTFRIDDLYQEKRWPNFRREALRETPIRSILSFRLFTSDSSSAALNVYADPPGAFSDEAEDFGYALATHAALAWDAVRRDGEFRSALSSRDVIGQAKGILMNHFDIDAVAAFELLRSCLRRATESSSMSLSRSQPCGESNEDAWLSAARYFGAPCAAGDHLVLRSVTWGLCP